MATADIFVRAFDKPGYVAHGQPVEVRIFQDANLRMQGGKRIRRDLGTCFRDRGEPSRFPSVRVTDETDLGDDAQFEKELAFVAGFAGLSEARRLPGRRCEIAVAKAAASAFAQDKLLPVLSKVGD